MKTRRIGALDVTVVGVGCNNFGWKLDETGSRAVVDAALASGINFFDTADMYGGTLSEEYLGRALRGRRNSAVIATTFGFEGPGCAGGASPAYVRHSIEGSLKRLGVDVIDLYQLHWPDPTTPLADTVGALDDLVRAGKVREIGCSNLTVAQIREAAAGTHTGAARFVSTQNEYSLLNRRAELELLPECEQAGMSFLPYFPLASGLLSGKYRQGVTPPAGARLTIGGPHFDGKLNDSTLSLVEELIAFAQVRGRSILELAFSALLAHAPVASVIAGATKPEQIWANAGAVGWEMDAADLRDLDTLLSRER
jgi:aryl-alcohol dehydrogenase-like predicted oxidoreductase